jgi:hypothetical protein
VSFNAFNSLGSRCGRNSDKNRDSFTGLPDGLFPDQKSHFGYILEDLGMENVVITSGKFGIFYDYWVYLMGIW